MASSDQVGPFGNDNAKKSQIQEASEDAQRNKNRPQAVLSRVPNTLAQALRSILVWVDDTNESDGSEHRGTLMVHKKYRYLFGCLTPRQIKSFLREQLFQGSSDREELPASSLLRSLFHPLWKVKRHEEDLFSAMAQAATLAKRVFDAKGGRFDEKGAEIFYRQLIAIVPLSRVLDETTVKDCWPRSAKERELLIQLLVACGEESAQSGEATVAGPSFVDWAREMNGERPRGATAAAQLSSFQDTVVQRYRAGDIQAVPTIKEYVDKFLDVHLRLMDASSAASLSNLGIIIDDVPSAEVQCDRLFDAALKLSMKDTRILFNYTEFLADVLGDDARCERLVVASYKDKAEIRLKARQNHTRLHISISAEADVFRAGLLGCRIDLSEESDAGVKMRRLWETISQPRLAKYILGDDGEASARLNATLDALIGRGSMVIATKVPMELVVWGARHLLGVVSWKLVMRVANDLVGESQANSREEKVGMRLNTSLVSHPNQLTNMGQLAAIWSQTGSILVRRLGKVGTARIAAAFLSSTYYGPDKHGPDRALSAWKALGQVGPMTEEGWRQLAVSGHAPNALGFLAEHPSDDQLASEVAQFVMAPDYVPAVHTPQEVAECLNWDRDPLPWAGGRTLSGAIDFLKEVAHAD